MSEVNLTATRQGEVVSYTLKPGTYTCGRHSSCQIRFPAAWLIASARHMEVQVDQANAVFIRDGVDASRSTNGTILNQRYLEADRWERISSGDEVQIGGNPLEAITIKIEGSTDATILLQDTNNHQSESTILISQLPRKDQISASVANDQTSWECIDDQLSIGRDDQNDVRLDGPTVSRVHALIRKSGRIYTLIDKSSNGTYVNGKLVGHSHRLRDGDEIKISSVTFYWRRPCLVRSSLGTSYRIDVRNLSLRNRLECINLSIEPGQLVAFVGGSGAGKSSLLTTVIGQNKNYKGHVLVNGREIKDSFSMIKQELGYVPQDDVIHSNLTVEEVLLYTARIKLPGSDQHRIAVDRVLDQLDISHRRKSLVSKLSGGQRKRVSIGVELIADPRILLLDEPTSGLDPGLDRKMMELLRSIADSGKTVALVTHATANVMLCDQVVFLARGGKLCFAGPPRDCLDYFSVGSDFTQVYQELDKSDSEIDYISQCFRQHQSKYLPPVNPSHQRPDSSPAISRLTTGGIIARIKNTIRQLPPVLQREVKLIKRDYFSLLLSCFTAPAAILLCIFASRNASVFAKKAQDILTIDPYTDAIRVLLVIVSAAAWVALSSQLQSIVKERAIFCRERAFNLTPEAYFASKVAAMVGLAAIQSVLMTLTLTTLYSAPVKPLGSWASSIGLLMFVAIISLGAQGLMISSLVRNNQQASGAAPLLLIPQLIFSGASFKLAKSSEWVYYLVSSRWVMRGAGAVSGVTSLIPEPLRKNFTVELDIYRGTWANYHLSLKILALQAIVFLAICFFSILFFNTKRE